MKYNFFTTTYDTPKFFSPLVPALHCIHCRSCSLF